MYRFNRQLTEYYTIDIVNNGLAEEAAGISPLSLRNFIPIVASIDAYQDMKQVCF